MAPPSKSRREPGTGAGHGRRTRRPGRAAGSAGRNAAQHGLAPLSDPAETGLLQENLAAAALHAFAVTGGIRLFHWRDRPDWIDGSNAFLLAVRRHARQVLDTRLGRATTGLG
jgi:hypothetical protein